MPSPQASPIQSRDWGHFDELGAPEEDESLSHLGVQDQEGPGDRVEPVMAPTPKPVPYPFEFGDWYRRMSTPARSVLYRLALDIAPREHELAVGTLLLSVAHRYFKCPEYGRCLTKAAVAKWPSFTCRECPLVGPLPRDPSKSMKRKNGT